MKISDWLKIYRKQSKVSQKELAEKVTALGHQITDTQISNYEREYDKDKDGNPTRPPERFVEFAAQVLNRPIEEARTAAGYSNKNDAPGFFSGIEKLSPEKQILAKRQIKAIIDSLADEEHDFDYGDFSN